MIGPFLALAINGFREAGRNRVTVVVGIFAIGLILTSSLLTGTVVTTFYRVLTDVGLGTMALLLAVLAIFLSSGLISREIERRTIFLMMARPITRPTFLIARATGNMLTLTGLLAAMALIFWATGFISGLDFEKQHAIAIGMLWFELLILTGIGFLISSFSSQLVSLFVTSALYFAGHLAEDLYRLALKATTPALAAIAKGAYYVLPNLHRVNFRNQATYGVVADQKEINRLISFFSEEECSLHYPRLGASQVFFTA